MATALSTRRLAPLLLLSAALALGLLYCVPALAHANLVSTSPPAGSETAEPPGQVELRFNEPVDAEFDPLVVRDSDGDRVDRGDARVDPDDARVVLASLEELPAGSYDVEWRITSIDGHVLEGRYGFDVIDSDRPAGEGQDVAGSEGEGQSTEERAGQAGREPATRDEPGGSVPILTYSALSLGVLIAVVGVAFLFARLARRPKP